MSSLIIFNFYYYLFIINLIFANTQNKRMMSILSSPALSKLTFVNNMRSLLKKYHDILTNIHFSARKRPIPYHRPTPTPPSSPSSSESSRHSNWSSPSHRSSCSASRSPSYTRWKNRVWIPSKDRRSFFFVH